MPKDNTWITEGWIAANWQAPAHVRAGTTTRIGGVSKAPFASLNLASHVNDDTLCVEKNRQLVHDYLQLPESPLWLEQVHGCDIALNESGNLSSFQADACLTHQPGKVCAVMTADCLPVLMTDIAGRCVAAVHAGWRGLAQGIILKTLESMRVPAVQVQVWLGPAIGPSAFEVGEEVRESFLLNNPAHQTAFVPGEQEGKWFMNIYEVARQQLTSRGVDKVFGGEFCTYQDTSRFYSYRRDGQTGRMVSLIWMEAG